MEKETFLLRINTRTHIDH